MTPIELVTSRLLLKIANRLGLEESDLIEVRRMIAAEEEWSRQQAEAWRNWNRVVVFGPEQKGVQGE